MYDSQHRIGDSSLEFKTKQNWVCEKIQSGSKVLKQSLEACSLSASNKEVNGKNRFLWTFGHNFPTNFSLKLWGHLEFFHKSRLDCCRTPIGCPSNQLLALLNPHFEYSTGNKVYTFFWSRVYKNYLLVGYGTGYTGVSSCHVAACVDARHGDSHILLYIYCIHPHCCCWAIIQSSQCHLQYK